MKNDESLHMFGNLAEKYYQMSPIDSNPRQLEDFIKNAEKVRIKQSFETKASRIQQYILNELQIPQFVESIFYNIFILQADKIAISGETEGIILLEKDIIRHQLDILNSSHLKINAYELLHKSMKYIKDKYNKYSEMEWYINKTKLYYEIKIIFNEIILLPFKVIG